MRVHTSFEEKHCGGGCSRQIATVGVCVRFIWGLLLPQYSIHGKIYCFTARCLFSWNYSFISLQTEAHMHGQAKRATWHLTCRHRAGFAFVLSICKSWQACRNPAVNNSLETGSQSAANVEARSLTRSRPESLVSSTLSRRWLIEVNASPSYVASSREDYEMKFRLLDDALNVVDMERR